MMNQTNWLRKSSLVVADDKQNGLDLSEMHFKFHITQSNEESPNTAVIRVYNLSAKTVKEITSKNDGVEYTRVVLQAGYQNSSFGVIFDGTIKQFRKGRENALDTYLDILAAAGDPEYNFGAVKATLGAGATPQAVIKAAAAQMGLPVGYLPPVFGGTLPRGKVLWGMARNHLRNAANSQGWSWSIQDGKVQMIPLDSYLPGEAVVLTSGTGMIGLPEQTDDGIKVRSLLNPKLSIGALIKIDNASINQTLAQPSNAIPDGVGQLPYNQWAGLQMLADVSSDGFYFLYVVEHVGDSRGNDWYSDMIGLVLDKSSNTIAAYG